MSEFEIPISTKGGKRRQQTLPRLMSAKPPTTMKIVVS